MSRLFANNRFNAIAVRGALAVLAAAFFFLPAPAAVFAAPIGPGGPGAGGYECRTTDGPGDHLPGRSCTCSGGEDSADCKKMRDEVCVNKHVNVCAGPMGGPVRSCECNWKLKTTRPSGARPAAPAPGKMKAR